MSDPETKVHCGAHGHTAATFMCVHLVSGTGCGFHCSSEDEEDPWPDAWCDLCDAAFQREGEWNESNEPDIQLICAHCYEQARHRNAEPPAPLTPGQVSVGPEELAAFVAASCERAKLRQEAAKRRWPLFGQHKRWLYDDEASTMRFFDLEGGPTLVADVAITGSFSTQSSTWMWAWGNDEYPAEAQRSSALVRRFGEVRGIEKLANAHWSAEEVDGWEVTQIAADLLDAQAIYRAPFDHLFVFMLLSNFRMLNPN